MLNFLCKVWLFIYAKGTENLVLEKNPISTDHYFYKLAIFMNPISKYQLRSVIFGNYECEKLFKAYVISQNSCTENLV